MKIIYCIHSVYNPGGMERVLLNKVSYLVSRGGYDITVVTTDQHGRPPFYPFPGKVKMIDLGINYSEDNSKTALQKITGYLRRRKKHRKALTELLYSEKADIVISLYPSESSFIPDINDGSKKVLELHLSRFFRIQYGRRGLIGMIDRLRTIQDRWIAGKFDRFIVLTKEDRDNWGNLQNIEVIPNAAMNMSGHMSDVSRHRIIAVGRLDYQKGFDRLIEAWDKVCRTGRYNDWHLDVFGQGEWYDMLNDMIRTKGLEQNTEIHKPTNRIGEEYAASSMIVMTSHYEGFGMVLVEAMSCGVPAISFDCQCGPKDIIKDGDNGFLVKDGDIDALAGAMVRLMDDEALRKRMSLSARKITEEYSEESIMGKWIALFDELTRR